MTVRAYTRVSSLTQVEQYSLSFQADKAEAWAKFQGLKPVKLYEERGISGTRDDRPQLTQLLDDLREGDTVVIYSLSRLGRGGVVQLLGIVDQIRQRGARLVSLTENVDTESYTGRAMLAILAALAEMEIETTRERTTAGRLQAAAQGVFPHGDEALPVGWRRGEDGRPVESTDAPAVREIFRLAQGGTSFLRIAADLNRLGIPSREGKAWKHTAVMRVIRTSAYWTGTYHYRAARYPSNPELWIPLPVPPLVTQAEWEGAQRARTLNHPHRNPEKYPLTGHLLCACGTPLSGSTINRPGRKPWRHYACNKEIRRTPACPVNGRPRRTWGADTAEQATREALTALLRSPEALASLLARETDVPDPHREEREELEARRQTVIDLHIEGLIDREEFRVRREALSARLAALQPPTPALPVGWVEAGQYAQAAETMDGEAYRQLLSLLGVRVRLRASGGAEIVALTVPV